MLPFAKELKMPWYNREGLENKSEDSFLSNKMHLNVHCGSGMVFIQNAKSLFVRAYPATAFYIIY
jgi:hypothetical protein